MKIATGKKYITRDGKIAKVMNFFIRPPGEGYFVGEIEHHHRRFRWNENGVCINEPLKDLIEEILSPIEKLERFLEST